VIKFLQRAWKSGGFLGHFGGENFFGFGCGVVAQFGQRRAARVYDAKPQAGMLRDSGCQRANAM
jgi:hypothetical protein